MNNTIVNHVIEYFMLKKQKNFGNFKLIEYICI